MMASLHYSWGRLPDDRVALYQQMVDLLLVRWQEARLGEEAGITRLIAASKLESALERVAYEAHARQQGGEGGATADIDEGLLRGVLKDEVGGDWNRAGDLLDYIQQRAGLLIWRDHGVYAFPHRSYQEYLAGCHLAAQSDFPARAAQLAAANYGQWREVLLWAVGAMARLKKLPWAAVAVVSALCPADPPAGEAGEAAWRTANLAGEALLEVGLPELQNGDARRALDRVRDWLAAWLGRGGGDPRERAAAGRTLARLGDPRPGVGLDRETGLPDIAWISIPAGPFLMGTPKSRIAALVKQYGGESRDYEGETPQHETPLAGFLISRYPVTQKQFRAFVDAGGYAMAAYWTEAANAGVWLKEGQVKGRFDTEPRVGPERWGEPFDLDNHPVVGVTWYEALAFCRWLTDLWRERRLVVRAGAGEVVSPQPDQVITLPSEGEWEKAARGQDGRDFPWEGGADPNRANYGDTGIHSASAVGCFPGGKSPYGVEDLSGNVSEWTRSVYLDYPYKPEDKGREELGAGRDRPRVLRGGAYYSDALYVRCASRGGADPFYHLGYDGFRVVVASPVSL